MTRRNWNEIKKESKATPEQVEQARQELARSIVLHEMRTAMGYTQTQLAEVLGMSQSGISRLEGQTDMLLSTLRSYVEALGGKLELVAEFNNDRYVISAIDEVVPRHEHEREVEPA
jgi:predicted transcriptional regulator